MHVRDDAGTVTITRTGRGWVIIPRPAWDAFVAAVKRGDYDPRTPDPRPGAGTPDAG